MEQVLLRIVRDDGLVFDIDNLVWMIPSDGLENWANLPHSVVLVFRNPRPIKVSS